MDFLCLELLHQRSALSDFELKEHEAMLTFDDNVLNKHFQGFVGHATSSYSKFLSLELLVWRLKPACGTLCGSCGTILSSLLDPVNPSLFDTSGGWCTYLDKSYTFFKLFIFLNTQLQGLHLRLRLCTGAEDNAVKEADAEAIKFAVVSSTEEEFHVV